MSQFPLDQNYVREKIKSLEIDLQSVSIRELNRLVDSLSEYFKIEFLRFEFGIPGLKPSKIGIKEEIKILEGESDSIGKYPPFDGISRLKNATANFMKQFLDIDVGSNCCIPTVGAMHGGFICQAIAGRIREKSGTILYLDPGFPVNKLQTKFLGLKEQSIDLYFALGKAYEDVENYEKSYEYLEKGNKLKKTKINYQIDNQVKLFNSITKVFEDIDIKSLKKTSSNKFIIFICGMPRSGTTLVEQIIAAHPEVSGAGELIYLQNSIEQYFVEDYKLNKQKIIDAASSNNNILEKQYYELLSYHQFTSNIITDKAPQNFRWLGFIKIFFPNSKIIHCNRNAKDNCLSLFKNNFASAHMDWSYDQKDIAEYYNLYSKLMKFWNKKIPHDIYNANYEKIVQNKEIEIKKLIQFCGLKWDPACLNHHEHIKTPISTASVVQARKPIYDKSVNSNVNFSKNLKNLFSKIK